ncbi:c-type cytochrome [Stutzerimonas tarimensis]|uniref:C-type cytochrome n=1 Tax=Stutzerimonas tarimensis TaxID=1507735 RepID=A0ABV7T514_9GAMM
MKALIVGGLSAVILAAGLAAQAQQPDIEDQIEFRQAGYKFMSWNMGKIKAQVIDGSVEYDPLQVQAAANAIAAISNSGMGALFSPGSSRAEMGEITALRPEFFQNLDEAGRLGRNFNVAANNLASEAASGDQARIRRAFGEVGQTCKACHDEFRFSRQ